MCSFKLASIDGSTQESIANLNLYVFANDPYIKEPSLFSALLTGVSTLQDFLTSSVTEHTTNTENSAPEFIVQPIYSNTSNRAFVEKLFFYNYYGFKK